MDIIKNKKKMMDGFNDCINHGLNVIVDNTNYTLEQRKVFIDIANKKSYKVKILFQDIPFEICNHLNNFRVEKGEKDKISIITYRKMLKYFEKPTYKEGEIIRLTKIYDFDDKTVYDYKFS
jgi:tRNA uridine 5-carbamoylmethylation protein Kti12